MAERYIATVGTDPIGPVPAEVVVRGLQTGRIPPEALACPVGGTNWTPIAVTPDFAPYLSLGRPPPPHTTTAHGGAAARTSAVNAPTSASPWATHPPHPPDSAPEAGSAPTPAPAPPGTTKRYRIGRWVLAGTLAAGSTLVAAGIIKVKYDRERAARECNALIAAIATAGKEAAGGNTGATAADARSALARAQSVSDLLGRAATRCADSGDTQSASAARAAKPSIDRQIEAFRGVVAAIERHEADDLARQREEERRMSAERANADAAARATAQIQRCRSGCDKIADECRGEASGDDDVFVCVRAYIACLDKRCGVAP